MYAIVFSGSFRNGLMIRFLHPWAIRATAINNEHGLREEPATHLVVAENKISHTSTSTALEKCMSILKYAFEWSSYNSLMYSTRAGSSNWLFIFSYPTSNAFGPSANCIRLDQASEACLPKMCPLEHLWSRTFHLACSAQKYWTEYSDIGDNRNPVCIALSLSLVMTNNLQSLCDTLIYVS